MGKWVVVEVETEHSRELVTEEGPIKDPWASPVQHGGWRDPF